MSAIVYAVTHTVTTPPLTDERITPGKLYRVLYETENSFDIIDDNGRQLPCFWQDCVFGDAWTRCELIADEPAQVENPPAFPRDHRHLGHNGMDMRDWFAGRVVGGILANSENAAAGAEPTNCALSTNPGFPKWLAKTAYRVADAMLAARAKGGA